jgi:ABC-type oligopeptide transport system substrate-binding subunit
MQARGMRLNKEVEPTIFYVGFNMQDPLLGAAAGERGRKLRQAMSVAVDAKQYLELFLNGRGLPAQTPLPPGIFGYDAAYKNPYRQYDVARARQLLAEAGYRNGIDPASNTRLKLTFDTSATTASAGLPLEFLAAAWREIGLDIEISSTTYNQFQDKVRRGAYQIFIWGWLADFPDPENFFFLLECQNARSKSNGPNTADFCNAEFDRLYTRCDEHRSDLIRRMREILERERPWIEALPPGGLPAGPPGSSTQAMGISFPATVQGRTAQMRAHCGPWNAPVRWPLYLMLIFVVAVTVPAVRTYYRERL